MNVSTNSTVKQPFQSNRNQTIFITQVTSLAVLGAIIILGNLASIITFIKTQSLRRRSHYLIISLSVADLLVGVVVLMFMYYFLTGPRLNTYAYVLEFLDTLTGLASILTLSAISIERFSAILFPFRHRMLRFRTYVALFTTPWIVAAVVAVLSFAPLVNRLVYYVFMHLTFIVTALALLIITVSYISMGCNMRQKNNPSTQNQNRELREKRLVVTLLIVTLSSLVTWMPLQGFVFVKNLCKYCPLPDFNDVFVMKFVQFCNSGLNIFIYMVRMTEFRKAFLVIFCRRKASTLQRRLNEMQNTNKAFTIDETDQVTRSKINRVTEFDKIQETSEVPSNELTNAEDNQNNSHLNNNIY